MGKKGDNNKKRYISLGKGKRSDSHGLKGRNLSEEGGELEEQWKRSCFIGRRTVTDYGKTREQQDLGKQELRGRHLNR